MRVTELRRAERRVELALIFDTDDEVISTLEAFARENDITAAHFTAIGAFRRATLAYFDWEIKDYRDIPVTGQAEVTSLVGDIGVHDGEVKVHAHGVLGRPDGSTVAGHVREGHVRPTLELFLTTYPDGTLERVHDPETGLDLIHGEREA